MKSAYRFFAATAARGLFLIIPIGIVVIMLGKVYSLLQRLMTAMRLNFEGQTFMHTSVKNIIAIFFLLLICFLAGMLTRLKIVRKVRDWLEVKLLRLLPGYEFMKSAAQDLLGVTSRNFREVVILKEGESFLLAFKVEDVTPAMVMVFVPTAPEPRSGRMLIVDKKRIISTSLKNQQAFALIKSVGIGSGEVLGSYLTGSPPIAGNK